MCEANGNVAAPVTKDDQGGNNKSMKNAAVLPTSSASLSSTIHKKKKNPRLTHWPEDPSYPATTVEEEEHDDEKDKTTSSSSSSSSSWSFWLGRSLRRQFQNWTYSYMNVVLDQGKHQTRNNGITNLTKDDLFPVPATMRSEHLVQLYHEHEKKKKKKKNRSDNEDLINSSNSSSNRQQQQPQQSQQTWSLLWTLWNIAAPTYVPAGICELIVVLCGTALPLLVRELLRVLQAHPQESIIRQGLPYAIAIFFVSICNGLANHRHRHLAIKTGIALRSSLINLLYQHILQLSPAGQRGLTQGEITNLVAVDTQKVLEVTQEGHLIWALPLSIGLVSILLYQTMGPSTMVGILVLLLFVPLIQQVMHQMLVTKSQRVQYSDARIEVVSHMLQGIKVTKLNHYEENYHARITTIRNQELHYLNREMAIWATTLLMTVASPVVATGATFATFVLLDNDDDDNKNKNVLEAADTFGVLLLFSALRFPINFAGRLIGKAAQAWSAIQRIALFFNRPLRHPPQEQRHDTNHHDDAAAAATTATATATATNPMDNEQQEETQDKRDASSSLSSPDQNRVGAEQESPPPLSLVKASFRIGDNNNEANLGNDDDSDEDDIKMEKGGSHKSSRGRSRAMDLSGRSGGDASSFTVGEFTFDIAKGQVLAVCGPVGSGKSTLLNGILDEAEALEGTIVTKHGKVAYVPQTPFILNQTVQENILFGLPMDESRYNAVLDACCLRTDLEQLGASGDQTEIGERGVTLSGGQKQRVSLARAAYAQSDLIILDDPFSALDSGTGKLVFERLLSASASSEQPHHQHRHPALLRNSAVLLVTHASHFISHHAIDQILLIAEGRNQFLGTWEELTVFKPTNEVSRRAVEFIQSSVRESTQEEEHDGEDEADEQGLADIKMVPTTETSATSKDEEVQGDKEKGSGGRLIQVEQREHGLSSIKTWLLWFQRAGGIPFFTIQVIFMTLDRSLYVAVEWFLARWTSAATGPVNVLGWEFPPQTDGLSAQSKYLTVYATLIGLSILATFFRSEWAVTGGGRATKNVFNTMLSSVLRAPLSYFETVPTGRILNRFTYDTDVNDVALTQVMSMFMISCSWYVAGVCIQTIILPWSALVLFPVSVMYWCLMLHYRMSGPDLQRLDALSRSPLQSMVNECLEGSTSIRVFQQDRNFVHKLGTAADTNSSALLNFVSAQRWLGIRMELLGSIVVFVSSALVVCLNETLGLETGLVGLLIMWSANFTTTLNFLVDTFSETEAAITAIERVDAMANLPFEKPMETNKRDAPPKSWPENGLLEFDQVSLRYREGLPLALNDLSFRIPAGKTCGVVGRTGAGKSSLSVALFRLVEIESGRILLDGVDLGSLGLSDVRGRGISIIPQDPFLAGATLRECLDPFGLHTDQEIVDALQLVRLGSNSVSAADANMLLSTKLEEGGSNYLVGERQLLNLARALLSQPKLLVLDKATASIDGGTDAFIQRMLWTRFPDTLVTVAHRLNTNMDYDLFLVMDAGRAAEFASPNEQLDIPGGVFSELVDATGAESSKALREMPNKHQQRLRARD
jgi:ABC-type multidrug transport system fused ATPase/permease subunit